MRKKRRKKRKKKEKVENELCHCLHLDWTCSPSHTVFSFADFGKKREEKRERAVSVSSSRGKVLR